MAAKGWKEIPIGGTITEAGNAKEFKTGSWRVMRPIHDKNKCTSCMLCWLYCPDQAILQTQGHMDGINYDYCKGCGLCSSVCPAKAIEMKAETEFLE
ncbi:MAG: 4Fe-4S binding protein [Synergistales bacterium]|nr:4Fe-4S binding protein [Synergistales bacterium]MDI9390350.1 pyruvate synthase subunit PorD [Synergistota bacterium]HPU78526.1 pyruvate synthase subunit PorD [Thermosynergistes sp.]